MKNNFFIGCSGFSSRDWKGIFFPEDLPSKEQLSFYSTKFNTVEINSTFYRKPRQQTLSNWYNLTNDGFKFFIKIPKTITHIKKLDNTKNDASAFCNYIKSGINEKLAGFLYQLPPSFHYNEDNLEKVLKTVDSEFLNVVEFRHKSWWNEEIPGILKENNIVFSGVSFPKEIPDEFIINNENFAYYRLHGVPILFKSQYTNEEIENLAKKIKSAKEKVYVFFNNTWGIAGINNALYLKEILEKN